MHMLRHDDVPDQADAESVLQYTQSVRYDSFQGIVVKERQTPSAGDRPEVRITRLVIFAKMRGHGAERISSSPPGPKECWGEITISPLRIGGFPSSLAPENGFPVRVVREIRRRRIAPAMLVKWACYLEQR